MRSTSIIEKKVLTTEELGRQAQRWKLLGKKTVFTNGCFDILHQGHLEILSKAAELGDVLIVGVNADSSVKKLKGDSRPVNNELFRSEMLSSLLIVDNVVVFEEETPLNLIKLLEPDVLVKGGDYTIDQIVGAEDVLKNGGTVEIIPFVKGYSTTSLIEKIQGL